MLPHGHALDSVQRDLHDRRRDCEVLRLCSFPPPVLFDDQPRRYKRANRFYGKQRASAALDDDALQQAGFDPITEQSLNLFLDVFLHK